LEDRKIVMNTILILYVSTSVCTAIGLAVGVISARYCIQYGRDMERKRCDDMLEKMFDLTVKYIVMAKIEAEECEDEE
jgi:Flp pilus assembly protein TadB